MPIWPDPQQWRAYGRFLAIFCASFFPLYAGAGLLASRAQSHYALYLPWETAIPRWDWMVLPYLSLYTAYVMPLFCLPHRQMPRLTRQSLLALLLALPCFVLLPARPGFPPVTGDTLVTPLLTLVQSLDTRHNLLPSLHVAFASLILGSCARHVGPPMRLFFGLWLAVLAASTVLVHQHHVLDVLSGFGLAWLVARLPLEQT